MCKSHAEIDDTRALILAIYAPRSSADSDHVGCLEFISLRSLWRTIGLDRWENENE